MLYNRFFDLFRYSIGTSESFPQLTEEEWQDMYETALIFPLVWLIIKIQSPGPIFFKQARTGLDGKTFNMLKFRSMHVNDDADKIQATKVQWQRLTVTSRFSNEDCCNRYSWYT